jgi:hypothetical protein
MTNVGGMRQRLKGSVWLAGGCGSWYLNSDGAGSSGKGDFWLRGFIIA